MLPRIIGIVGAIRAGKTSAARHLEARHGYQILSNSEILREIAVKLDISHRRDDLRRLGDAIFSTLGNDAIAKFRLAALSDRPVVIEGLRYPEEIKAYRAEPSFRVLGLRADDTSRHMRLLALIHEGKDTQLDHSQFESLKLARSEVHVDALVQDADAIIQNDNTIERLCSEIDIVLERWAKDILCASDRRSK